MKLVFMGTPAFAVPALKKLVEARHTVAAVYTQPPRPAGRGQQEKRSPVHELAIQYGIPVETPVTLRQPEVQQRFREYQADVAVVAAYGLILPEPILTAYPQGCINIHPSLLPRWRGAAPIQRQILAGDTETGVAIMQMDKGLDTGSVLALRKFPMPEKVTAPQLHDRLAKGGADLLIEVLDKAAAPKPQLAQGVTYADKLTKEEGKLDWTKPAEVLDRKVRALNPWPGTYFEHAGETIKVLEAEINRASNNMAPGTVMDDRLQIACGTGSFRPLILQRPGRKAVPVDEFLRGCAIRDGTVLSSE